MEIILVACAYFLILCGLGCIWMFYHFASKLWGAWKVPVYRRQLVILYFLNTILIVAAFGGAWVMWSGK
jgi:hypothetical protein